LTRVRRWLALLPMLGLVLLLPPAAATADTLQPNATVIVNDFGFSPANVIIALGGTIVFTNQGSVVHQITTGSAPFAINLPLNPNQTVPIEFDLAGVYHYTASTDCGPGINKPQFQCIDYTITVIDAKPGIPLPAGTPFPTPIPTTTPLVPSPAPGVQRDALVAIYDNGVPATTVTITVGGSVTWINYGNSVHTATSISGTPGFDTGGLGPGGKNTFGFFSPGTWTYTSQTDCLDDNHTPGFNCGPYQVVVTTAQPTNSAPPTAASPGPPSMPSVPPASNTTVTIDDTAGFQPHSLTVKAGQFVTWINKGNNVHSVVSDLGENPGFDSGGIGAGMTFSFQFTTPGTYGYHSVTDATYVNNGACNCAAPFYGVFAGTIVVGS
jgi:plastocyanin